jgi:hypothetical protein
MYVPLYELYILHFYIDIQEFLFKKNQFCPVLGLGKSDVGVGRWVSSNAMLMEHWKLQNKKVNPGNREQWSKS